MSFGQKLALFSLRLRKGFQKMFYIRKNILIDNNYTNTFVVSCNVGGLNLETLMCSS
jgi:hypothetical protein